MCKNCKGWMCLIGAILIQLTYGYYYSLGNMAPYIADYLHSQKLSIDNSAVMWLSAVFLSMQGVGMPLGGMMEKKTGIRPVAIVSMIIHVSSVAFSYFSIRIGLPGLIVTYALLQGLGVGFGYSATMSTASAWFPNNRGLIIGFVLAGYGAGSVIFTPIQTAYINPLNLRVNNETKRFDDPDLLARVPNSFLIFAAIIAGLQAIGIGLVNNRPKEDLLEDSEESDKKEIDDPKSPNTESYTGSEDEIRTQNSEEGTKREEDEDIPPKQAMKMLDFYLLFLVLFNIAIPVVAVSSLFKLFGKEYIPDDQFLALAGTISSVFNALGRILWGLIVDRFSFKVPTVILFATYALLLFTFPHLSGLTGGGLKAAFIIWVCGLYFLLSGSLVCAPKAVQIVFGPKYFAVIYGCAFMAVVPGGIFACLAITLANIPGWIYPFYLCAVACLLGLFIILWVPDLKMPKKLTFLNCLMKLRRC